MEIFAREGDLPVIFNCVHIFGNLHQDLLLTAGTHELQTQVEKIENIVLDRLEWVCGTYPRYENAL